MIITTITHLLQNGQQVNTVLDPGKHFIHCISRDTAEIVCRELCTAAGMQVQNAGTGEPASVEEQYIPHVAVSDTCQTTMMPLSSAFLRLPLEEISEAANGGDTRRLLRDLTSLIDSGRTDGNLDDVHAWLTHFVEVHGRSRGPGTPLATIQSQKTKLVQERQNVCKAWDSAGALATDIHKTRSRLEQVRTQRATLHKRLRSATDARIQQVRNRLGEVRNRLDGFRGKLCLESGKAALLKRKETLVVTARLQCARTSQEIEDTRQALDRLPDRRMQVVGGPAVTMRLPGDLEHELRILAGSLDKINAGLKEANRQAGEIGRQIADEEHKLSLMPDFTRITHSPADWLSQLATSLDASIHAREQDAHNILILQQQIHAHEEAIEKERQIFSKKDKVSAVLDTYHHTKQELDEKSEEVKKQLYWHQSMRDNIRETLPGVATLGFGSAFGLLFVLGVYASQGKTPLLYAGAVLFLAAVYFLSWFTRARFNMRQLTQALERHQALLNQCIGNLEENEQRISHLLALAGCATIRELEARYDQYVEDTDRLDGMREELAVLEESLQESDKRIPLLFSRIQETLEPLDEHPEGPEEVEGCVGSAIRKSKEYHATVRHLANLRNQHQGVAGKRRFLEGELSELREKLAPLEHKVRARIRQNGFALESRYTDITGLLSAYERYVEEMHVVKKRRETLTALLLDLETRLKEEEALCARHAEELSLMLKEHGLEAAAEVEPAAKNASLIADIARERRALELELERLLQDTLPVLAENEAAGPDGSPDAAAVTKARLELASCETDYENLLKEYRDLRAKRAKILSGWRGLHEIDEDLAALELAETECRRRLNAGARAMALIDELAPKWRTHYAKAIAARAETMLHQAGIPAEISLDLSRNNTVESLAITVKENAESAISAGCLALRLAAIETLIPSEESAPLVVDAIHGAHMSAIDWRQVFSLLDQAADRRQIIVLSEDAPTARAARESGWPVLAM